MKEALPAKPFSYSIRATSVVYRNLSRVPISINHTAGISLCLCYSAIQLDYGVWESHKPLKASRLTISLTYPILTHTLLCYSNDPVLTVW